MYPQSCAPSEDSDQSSLSRSPIRIFAVYILDSQECKASGADNEDSDQTAQSDLSLRWAHMSKGKFYNVVTQLSYPQRHSVLLICEFLIFISDYECISAREQSHLRRKPDVCGKCKPPCK